MKKGTHVAEFVIKPGFLLNVDLVWDEDEQTSRVLERVGGWHQKTRPGTGLLAIVSYHVHMCGCVTCSTLILGGLALHNRLDHGATNLVRLLKPRLKKRRRVHKPLLVQLKVSK